jgi:hypothetical protein
MTPEQLNALVAEAESEAMYNMPTKAELVLKGYEAGRVAEREACAKIAEAEGCSDPQCLSCVGNVIAQAIRTGRSEGSQ